MTDEERRNKARDFIEVRCINVDKTAVYESLDLNPYDDADNPNDDADAVIELIENVIISFPGDAPKT